jgi:glycosyltransferase involved in cell wall biosynthesis
MKNTQRIFTFHLLNDYSGSPKVLMQLLKGWVAKGFKVHLSTSLHRKGFLSDIPGVHYQNAWYRFSPNPWLRLVYYSLSQLMLMLRLIFVFRKNDLVYINTVLPFGAGIAGRLRGCRVIYHIHESTVNPRPLKWFLFKMVTLNAAEIINVSEYVAQSHGITTKKSHLLYNAIENDFIKQAQKRQVESKKNNVLMVCSLKAYKGVNEFVQLAARFPEYKFRLVVNAGKAEINAYFNDMNLPGNLEVFDAQTNLHPFYAWAGVIVNLSRPDGWIETFGLTIIEGMAYGLPAIVPPVGGITEVIEAGKTGYIADSRRSEELDTALESILEDERHYFELSANARKRILMFSEDAFIKRNIEIISAS